MDKVHTSRPHRSPAELGRYAAIPLALFLSVLARPLLAAEDLLSRLEGVYEVHNDHCTEMGEGGKQVVCDPGPTDRLVIKRLSATRAHFHVTSTQVNLHGCEVEGVADLVRGDLVYVALNARTPGQGIRIHLSGTEITFSYLKRVNELTKEFCGTRAYLENIRFPKSSKESTLDEGRNKSL
jgi:hypothetical protein